MTEQYRQLNRGNRALYDNRQNLKSLVTVCKVQTEHSYQWTVYAAVQDISVTGGTFPFPFYPRIEILYGDGGASLTRMVDITDLGRATCAGSYVEVRAGFCKPDGTLWDLPDAHLTATFVATVARGTDPETLPNSLWMPLDRAALGVIRPKPSRLLRVRGFQTGGAAKFLVLCDRTIAPVLGNDPIDVFVLPAAPGSIDIDFPHGDPYTNGIAWGVSSTENVFTPDPQIMTIRAEVLATREP
jgi:hypothetical protein